MTLRRTALRKIGKRANWKKALDLLCKQVVFKRDRCCQWCKRPASGSDHWCHVRSRGYLSSRWDTRNSFRGCPGCHLRWHQQPLTAAAWFEKEFPDRWQAVRFYDHGAGAGKIDRVLIRLALEQELKKYEAPRFKPGDELRTTKIWSTDEK